MSEETAWRLIIALGGVVVALAGWGWSAVRAAHAEHITDLREQLRQRQEEDEEERQSGPRSAPARRRTRGSK